MSLELTPHECAMLSGAEGGGTAMAMRIVTQAARLLGAERLVSISSAHIDSGLYHGVSGTLFAERLAQAGARVSVRSTLNVSALDLTGCAQIRLGEPDRSMAVRQTKAYTAMGCEPTWTCAPYQAGHRPQPGTDVAWGESNAVVFCNSVLGARTNRYGDLLDIACAITGRAPYYGLHVPENRLATFVFDVDELPRSFLGQDVAWPVLGSLYGRMAGTEVGVITGLDRDPGEDALKAFGAAAASSGAVGLFHIAGITPEASTLEEVLRHPAATQRIKVTQRMIDEAKRRLSTAEHADRIDAVAVGSPHLSPAEFEMLAALIGGRRLNIPLYACTGRHVLPGLEKSGLREILERAGVTIVADTCVVVTPIMKEMPDGILMTNSGKFAHYAPGNTGYGVLYGSMAECVESAVCGKPAFDGNFNG